MAGFFGRLFNRNNDNKKEDSYFLDPDSAKTVGDINYMRKSATVRRTFPKTKDGGGAEITIEVSAMEKREIAEGMAKETPQTPTPTFEPKAPERRSAKDSSSMDMFRKMAKDIRKPQ